MPPEICRLWNLQTFIVEGELPNLEVLKLVFHACRGKVWYPIVRAFNRLKLLLINTNDYDAYVNDGGVDDDNEDSDNGNGRTVPICHG
ncbi:hypothetical protein BC332_30085 [Capsicum chinense]|nr:hypothetical protein BC332_30085 [Capsicum chinense]